MFFCNQRNSDFMIVLKFQKIKNKKGEGEEGEAVIYSLVLFYRIFYTFPSHRLVASY